MSADTEFLTTAEAAERLRVTMQTLQRALRRGQIPSVRVGKVYRVPADALEPATQQEDVMSIDPGAPPISTPPKPPPPAPSPGPPPYRPK